MQESQVRAKRVSPIFFLLFAAILLVLHLPFLKLPFHWDELGQFVPAALDLYRYGDWVPQHTALPNVHPPGVMALLAAIWHVVGYSILSARLTMLLIAAAGVFLSYSLAIRLSHNRASGLAAVLFLLAAPLFYTQSMMVLLDMPAMTLTVLALLLFLDRRYAACALVCTALVLVKETAITTPLVFAIWLFFKEKRFREAFYFLAPAIALSLWLAELHHVTGSWLGNPEFAQFNVSGHLSVSLIMWALGRRIYELFLSDGHFIGAAILIVGRRQLRGTEWSLAFWVALAQVLMVTILGGAVLDRYLLPVLPILYAAMATAWQSIRQPARWITQAAMVGLLVAGWFWNPPYSFPYENNLAMVDCVNLQQQAAAYLMLHESDKRIVSGWPLTDALKLPELGYVQQPFRARQIKGFTEQELDGVSLDANDVLVVFLRQWSPDGQWLDVAPVRALVRRFNGFYPQVSSEQIQSRFGVKPIARWDRRGQWIEIYERPSIP